MPIYGLLEGRVDSVPFRSFRSREEPVQARGQRGLEGCCRAAGVLTPWDRAGITPHVGCKNQHLADPTPLLGSLEFLLEDFGDELHGGAELRVRTGGKFDPHRAAEGRLVELLP